MTSNHHAPYDLGYTRATMAWNKGKRTREGKRISKNTSQFGLQAATRLHEAGIASNRRSACCGEYVPGSCTCPKPVAQLLEGAVEGRAGDWGEVVTR